MKKWYTGILIIGGVVTLVALSETTSFGEKFLGSEIDKPIEVQEDISEGREILKQSIEKMTKVDSFQVIGERMQESKESGQPQTLIEAKVLLGDEIKIHSKSSLPGEKETSQGVEAYLNGDQMFINTAGQWVMLPNSGGHLDKLKNINADQLNEVWEGNQVFEMKDNGDNYIVSVQDRDAIRDLMPTENIEETSLGENKNTEIIIEKATYHIKEIIVDSKSGKMSYKISEINEVDDNTFPDGVEEKAVEFIDGLDEINPGK